MKPTLLFTPNPAGEAEGFRDAGIETFRDRPFGAVAREAGQNSRDARAGDQPVVMLFERLRVKTEELPAIALYRDAVERCLAIARTTSDEKELEFFLQAKQVLANPELAVLKISDFNTTGLRGPCIPGTPFHALVKSTGISSKDNDTSGGSFGIGKSAVYAASDIQTAFYSTIWVNESGNKQFLAQGKTRLRSFKDAEGADRRSVGYWGKPTGFMPVENLSDVPEWMQRQKVGTTICAIGMRETDDWKYEIVASVIQNFFCAIHRREMGFEVDDVQVTDKTLLRLFSDERVVEAAREGGEEENFEFSRAMYDCLTSDDAVDQQVRIPSVGTFALRLRCADGLPKRIGIVRNGMYITDNLGHFGDKFLKFPMYRDFVAIVEPLSEPENKWLKRMENPRHDDLSAERIVDPGSREAARAAGKVLARHVRNAIKSIAKSIPENETDLEELSEFFATDEKGKADENGFRDPESHQIQPAPVRLRKSVQRPQAKSAGELGGGAQGKGDVERPGGGPGVGGGSGGSGTQGIRKTLTMTAPRTVIVNPSDLRHRQLFFTPAESGIAELTLEGTGISDPEKLELEDGKITVRCEAGKRQSLSVKLKQPYGGPVQITGWIEEGSSDETQG